MVSRISPGMTFVQLTRYSILATAVVLGTVCVVLPAALAWNWAWQRAEAQQRAGLSRLVELAAERGHTIVEQVRATLDGLEAPAGPRCSAADVARMRAGTIDVRFIEEIGFQRDDQLLCNSWGEVNQAMRLSPTHTVVGPGVQLRAAGFSLASPGTRLVSVAGSGYYAYVAPGRFVDIAVPDQVGLAVATAAGEAIAPRQQAGDDGERLRVTHADGIFSIVATLPMQQVAHAATRQRWAMLPLAALCSLAGLGGLAGWLRRRLSLAGELRVALARRQLQVVYQPLIDLASGRCIGAEALARWQHPSGRWITADVFIAEAERHGLVGRITVQVIQAVIQDMGPLLRHHPWLHISINLSAQDIDDDSARRELACLMALHGLAANQIWLEMTERGFMNAELARAAIGGLRANGHRILIDDFGTGYSSLSYLQTLPVDGLKIDKSFVDMIASDTSASGVIDHIIDMAKSLGLMIVAEGVETVQQAHYLRQRGVQFGQGWLFSKALPADHFLTFCQADRIVSTMGDPGQDQGNRR